MNIKHILVLALITLSALLAACTAGPPDWTGDPQLVHQLQIKMAEAEVKKILGNPSDISKFELLGITTDIWVYKGSETVTVYLQNGKLVGADLGTKEILAATAAEI